MNIVRGVLVTLLLFSLYLTGCSPKYGEMVVLEVGATQVKLSEYETFYAKNSGGWDVARQSTLEEREHFLDLLTNYKLKLQDAYDRNYLNDSDIVSELREYRGSLAATFMLEKELTEPGVKLLYDRRQEEVRTQHILISMKPGASPEESLKAYTKAMDIIRRAKSGENFDSLVMQNSDDPAAKNNQGDDYYFTSGQMVAQFEDAAYSMRKGEISSTPIRTVYGYFIIKLIDRKPNPGSIKVRHIMVRMQVPQTDSVDTAAALVRINAFRDSLKKGWEFSDLASKHSEDNGSAVNGGDLGWFERRRWVKPFDETAFALRRGEISRIVQTPFGFHIIKCDSIKPIPPFSAMRDDLKKVYQQYRYNDQYSAYIAQLKNDYHFSFIEEAFDSLLAHLDSTKTTEDSSWAHGVPQSVRMMPMMMVNGRGITVDTVASILDTRQEYRNTMLRRADLRSRMDRIAEAILLLTKSYGLEVKYPEFASLMKEYTDGVVLYKAEQQEVWNRTIVTDTALRNYYAQNKSKFMFPDRVNISVIQLQTDTLAALLYDSLQRGGDFSEFADRYAEDPDLKSKHGVLGLQPADTDTLTKAAALLAVGEISEPVEMEEGGYGIVKLLAKEAAREKTFEEAGVEVSNAYQEYESKRLERQWLERIKQKHPVKQNKEVLKDAFKSPEPPQPFR